MTAKELLSLIHRAGGRTRVRDGKLQIRPAALASTYKSEIEQHRAELIAMNRPLKHDAALLSAARRVFGPAADIYIDPLPGDDSEVLDLPDDVGWTLRRRLAACETVLQRDELTTSECEACLIGLQRHAGTHPAVDSMLTKLKDAKKSALTATSLAARRRRRG